MAKQVEHIRTKDGKPYLAGSLPLNEQEFTEMKLRGINQLSENTIFYTFIVSTQPIKKDGFGFRLVLNNPLEVSSGYNLGLYYILPKQWGYIFEVFIPDLKTAKEVLKYVLPIVALNAFDKRVGRKKLKEIMDGLKSKWGVKFLRAVNL